MAKIAYRPVWPVVLRVRQKLQGRWNYDPEKETGFTTYENRINLEFRLSRFDNLDLLYASGYTAFTPRPRLGGQVDPNGLSPLDAQGASPTEALGVQITHNFSPYFRVRGAWCVYDGFFWNFEDSDFAVLDGKASRWWIVDFQPPFQLDRAARQAHRRYRLSRHLGAVARQQRVSDHD